MRGDLCLPGCPTAVGCHPEMLHMGPWGHKLGISQDAWETLALPSKTTDQRINKTNHQHSHAFMGIIITEIFRSWGGAKEDWKGSPCSLPVLPGTGTYVCTQVHTHTCTRMQTCARTHSAYNVFSQLGESLEVIETVCAELISEYVK